MSKTRLKNKLSSGTSPRCKGNGWKLADVFNRVVPGYAVIHIGNHSQIDAVNARLLQHILNNAAFAWSGEQYLVDKLLASVLKERIERAHNVVRVDHGSGIDAGKLDEALECVSQMFNALEMMTESMRLRASSDDQHVARIETSIEPPIKPEAIDQATQHRAQRPPGTPC